jgi:hypothetical protein
MKGFQTDTDELSCLRTSPALVKGSIRSFVRRVIRADVLYNIEARALGRHLGGRNFFAGIFDVTPVKRANAPQGCVSNCRCRHLILDCFRADYGVPAIARVVFRHGRGDFVRLFAQVLLVDGAVFVDDECHDS